MIMRPHSFSLGSCTVRDRAYRKDLPKAIAWYELAAQLGHPLAQYNLAVMLAKGQGCEPDRNKALSWFQRAAEQGLAVAQTALRDFDGHGRRISSMDERVNEH